MELRHLRSFVVLSEELHFGRAATRIPLAQPALSQQIKQLERELGSRLFDRGPGGVRLTPAGETFLVHARTTINAAARALRAVREQADGVEGTLTVGVFAHGAAELTLPILRAFAIARPRVQLRVRELDFLQQTSELVEGRVDVALLRPPLADDRVSLAVLASEPRVAVVAADSPLADAGVLKVGDLLDAPVLAAHAAEPRAWTDFWRLTPLRGGLAPQEVGPGDVTTVNELLTALALRGCVTTTAASLERFYPSPAVRYLPVDDLDGCQIALGTCHPDEPLVAAFQAVALRVCADLSGLLTAPLRAGASAMTEGLPGWAEGVLQAGRRGHPHGRARPARGPAAAQPGRETS